MQSPKSIVLVGGLLLGLASSFIMPLFANADEYVYGRYETSRENRAIRQYEQRQRNNEIEQSIRYNQAYYGSEPGYSYTTNYGPGTGYYNPNYGYSYQSSEYYSHPGLLNEIRNVVEY